MYSVIAENSTSTNAKGEELKTFKDLNIEKILNTYEDNIRSLNLEDMDFKNKIVTQKEYLGFVSLTTGKEEDRPKLYVKDVIPLVRKKDKAQFGYSVIAQSVGSGIETRYTVFNRVFKEDPIQKDDIIRCTRYERDGQYFRLCSYQHIFF